MERIAFWSMASFSLFIYSSMAASSIGHVLLLPPGLFFTYWCWKKVPLPSSAWWLLVFMVIAILSRFLSESMENPAKTVGELRYFLAGILSIQAFTSVFTNKPDRPRIIDRRIQFLLHSSLIVAAVASVVGIFTLYYGYNPLKMKASSDPHRATGLYSMAITFGYGIQFMALINLGLLLFRKKVEKYVSTKTLLVTMVCIFLGLYYSGSRGAMLGFLLGSPFLFLRFHPRKFLGVMTVGVLLTGIAAAIVFSGGSKTTRFLLPAKHGSNMIRLSQFEAAIEAIKERPFLGHGYRNFGNQSERIKKEHNIAYPDFISHAHNNYLEIWADSGLFGLLAFLGFLWSWFFESWKRQDIVGDITLSIIVALAISGFFQCTIIDGENTFAIMFIYGLSQVTTARIEALQRLFKTELSTD